MSKSNLAAFDLEIAKEIPAGARNWQRFEPLGICCLALAFNGDPQVRVWSNTPKLSRETCREIVRTLVEYMDGGYRLVTWNGCKFDFKVLAEESGLIHECARMALEHTDLMLMVTFTQGHFLSLQAALDGTGLVGKLKHVTLKDGSVLKDMDGAMAPRLWSAGEQEAVLAYLKQDVLQLLALAKITEQRQFLRWMSKSGNLQKMPVKLLLPVKECFKIPRPDASWQRNPPRRQDFVSWMPDEFQRSVLKE